MQPFFMATAALAGTLLVYWGATRLYSKIPWPFLHPVLTTSFAIVLLLVLFQIPYDEYMTGGKWIDALLGPGVVALAYPLYTQRRILIKYWQSIIWGVLASLLSGMVSIFVFAKLAGLEDVLLMSLFPKSITTPVAIQVSDVLAGIPSMTVAFVMTAGFTGAIAGPAVMKLMRIRSGMSTGIALGSASHGVGLAKAAENGELSLSMGSVAMTLTAVIGSGLVPFVVYALSNL